MNNKDRLFVRALDYCHKHGEFTRIQLENDLGIKTPGDRALFSHLFQSGTNDTPPLLTTIPRDGVDYLVLSRTGEELALEYVELKEARESSKNAILIASISMAIATITGILQVISQLYQEQSRQFFQLFFN